MLIVTANSAMELALLKENQPDAIILAWPALSLRQQVFLNPEQMADTIRKLKEKGILVYINLLKMMMEEDLEAAKDAMEFCAKNDVDGIYIADEGYIPFAREAGLMDKLIYQPETLVTNALDVGFYRNLGFQAISLAHELSLDQVQQIAKEADGLEVLVQGRYSWMYSYRPLLENYLKEIDGPALRQGPAIYSLQEANRSDRMPVEQTPCGTIVYSSTPICSLSVLPNLKEAGIDRYRIDTYLEDEDYGIRQLNLYRSMLEAVNPAEYLEELIAKKHPDLMGSDQTWFNKTALRKEEAS